MDIDPQTVEWAFKGLISIIGAYVAAILTSLTKSVAALNIKMAVVVEQINSHDKRINRLENLKIKEKK